MGKQEKGLLSIYCVKDFTVNFSNTLATVCGSITDHYILQVNK